ncbi:selenide, water dikinase SelD [Natronosporangium hydrolyticum]|nr:selenide, water dikinase SelD [Natronosporangium hydrolyticum]
MTDSGWRLTEFSPGAGCACKLPLGKLEELLAAAGGGLAPASGRLAAGGELLVGAREGDDAAVVRLDADRALVFTTDFFTPIVDDPYDWGRIAAANALSDVYAMGGAPLLALNLTAWPSATLPMELLAEVLRGAAEVVSDAGAAVVGGHTIDDPGPKYGLAVVGLAEPGRLFAIDQLAAGDTLVLTKPLGTGVITTACKRGAASSDQLAGAVATMATLNAAASEAGRAAGVRAATDVTGFGLLGHLHRMLRASGLAAAVTAEQVPLLPGARELADGGHISGGTRANIDYLQSSVTLPAQLPAALRYLLHDAQTSGGLLLGAPGGGDALLRELAGRGVPAAAIGQVRAGEPGQIVVEPG